MENKTISIEKVCEIMGRGTEELEFTLIKHKNPTPQMTKASACMKNLLKKLNIQYETI